MKRLTTLTFFVLTLLVAPVPISAQQGTPTPSPSSAELRLLQEMANQLQSMSQNSSQTINGAVLLLGVCFVILMVVILVAVVWVARGGLNPIFETLRREQRRADSAEQSETHMRTLKDDSERSANEYRAKTAESLVKAAEVQERTVNILSGLESGLQAQARTDTAVAKIVLDINTHTDGSLADAKEKLETAANHVDQAAQTIDNMVTKDHLSKELKPIHEELKGIAAELRKKGDTGPLPPLPPESDLPDANVPINVEKSE